MINWKIVYERTYVTTLYVDAETEDEAIKKADESLPVAEMFQCNVEHTEIQSIETL
tara:strand:+ start:1229 stop:1396 length:168 start_codon:yes stop_codon:yes gene_type:complete